MRAQVAIGFGFTLLVEKVARVFTGQPQRRHNAKPKQTQFLLNTQLKTALSPIIYCKVLFIDFVPNSREDEAEGEIWSSP